MNQVIKYHGLLLNLLHNYQNQLANQQWIKLINFQLNQVIKYHGLLLNLLHNYQNQLANQQWIKQINYPLNQPTNCQGQLLNQPNSYQIHRANQLKSQEKQLLKPLLIFQQHQLILLLNCLKKLLLKALLKMNKISKLVLKVPIICLQHLLKPLKICQNQLVKALRKHNQKSLRKVLIIYQRHLLKVCKKCLNQVLKAQSI